MSTLSTGGSWPLTLILAALGHSGVDKQFRRGLCHHAVLSVLPQPRQVCHGLARSPFLFAEHAKANPGQPQCYRDELRVEQANSLCHFDWPVD